MTIDFFEEIKKSKKRILDVNDEHLFSDAIKCIEAGVYRAAYIMFWICCAESLRRKFKKATQEGDPKASKIHSKIGTMETQHTGVDCYLIISAFDYGFINDLEKSKLLYYFQMRSVFAHPYEEEPTMLDLYNIAKDITDIVLSVSTELGSKYIDVIIKKIEAPHAISQFPSESKKYIEEKASIIAERFQFESLKKSIEGIKRNLNNDLIRSRLLILANFAMLKVSKEELEGEEIHTLICDSPEVFALLINKNNIDKFGDINKTSIIEYLFAQKQINTIYKLFKNKKLSQNESSRFSSLITSLDLSEVLLCELDINIIFTNLINALESGIFDQQNIVCNYICLKMNKVGLLKEQDQEKLGEIIFRISPINGKKDIGSHGAANLLVNPPQNIPAAFSKGIVKSMFLFSNDRGTNELIISPRTYVNIIPFLNSLSNEDEIELEMDLKNIELIQGQWKWLINIDHKFTKMIIEKATEMFVHSPQSSTSTRLHSS